MSGFTLPGGSALRQAFLPSWWRTTWEVVISVVLSKPGFRQFRSLPAPTPDYHRSSDTADKIDVAGLIQVASFVRETIVYLSERETPLTSTLGSSPVSAPNRSAPSGRRASLGTVPDFAFSGDGVRVESVVPDSAAAEAGIQAGDILVGLGGIKLADLRSYADALAELEPGDTVEVEVLRAGRSVRLSATLGRR